MQQFRTYRNGFLDPESPNFDPNHAFLSSIEAEIITILQKQAAIWTYCLLCPFYENFDVAPLPEFKVRPHRLLIPKIGAQKIDPKDR